MPSRVHRYVLLQLSPLHGHLHLSQFLRDPFAEFFRLLQPFDKSSIFSDIAKGLRQTHKNVILQLSYSYLDRLGAHGFVPGKSLFNLKNYVYREPESGALASLSQVHPKTTQYLKS